jgi:Flp pilus assembly protein TadG
MITITKSAKRQRGQAVVESAFTMLIFLPVLIGIMDFGQFLYFHQSLTERARAGARYGAVHTLGDGSEAVNVAIYNNPAGAGGGATALLPCIASTCTANDGSAVQATVTATLTDATTDDSRVTVTISNYPFNFLTPVLSKSTWLRTIRASQTYEVDH